MEETYTIHKLKTWPIFFEAVMNGTKTFELRKNERNFKVGDRLDLMEYDPDAENYTGKHCHRYIIYILAENPFIDLKDNVILGLSFEPLHDKEITDADIEKWAKEEYGCSGTQSVACRREVNIAIIGAKAYRDGLITGTGKSKDKEIIAKQEELIKLLGHRYDDFDSVKKLRKEIAELKKEG